MFAVVGRGLFHNVAQNRFQTLGRCFFTLFQLITLDDWYEVYTEVVALKPSKSQYCILLSWKKLSLFHTAAYVRHQIRVWNFVWINLTSGCWMLSYGLNPTFEAYLMKLCSKLSNWRYEQLLQSSKKRAQFVESSCNIILLIHFWGDIIEYLIITWQFSLPCQLKHRD